MKKLLKIVGFSVLGLFALIGIFALSGILPEAPMEEEPTSNVEEVVEEKKRLSVKNKLPPAPTKKKERFSLSTSEPVAKESLPPPDAKEIIWDKTPLEQGLKIGDWITIEGYQDAFIGASIRVENGVNYGLEWNDPSTSLFGTNGLIDITSQPTAFPAPGDAINYISGSIENARENETVVRINEALLREETVLIRVTGQIDQISQPFETARYPNQQGLFLKKSVYVEFME